MNTFNKKSLFLSILVASCSSLSLSAAQLAKKPQLIIKAIPEAVVLLTRAIKQYPTETSAIPAYEKENSDLMVKCGKLLYDVARSQILDALSEIDSRITYWQYQRDHPWSYFVSKNPLKWVTGPKQEDEIETNLDILRSHQGELYVLLGQLSECGTAFNQGYKDAFLVDYTKSYEWIDQLLTALVRIAPKAEQPEPVPFIARVYQLISKLERVDRFKDDILADIEETEMPSFVARNWFKSGLLLMGMNYAYNNITAAQVQSSFATAQQGFSTVIDPVTATLKDALTPGWQKKSDQSRILPSLSASNETKIEMAKDFVIKMGEKYSLQEDASNVLKGFENNNYSAYEKFVEEVGEKESINLSLYSPFTSAEQAGKWAQNLKDYGRGLLIGGKLETMQLLGEAQEYALAEKKQYEKQYSAVTKVVLLIPAVLAAGAAYVGYQKLMEKNYGPLRKSLVEINSLFVDPSKPLNDEQYGEMVYLVYMLKKRAQRELPVKKNVQVDFIRDLERIESQEYPVAAKRAIIEDMFKKYSFLGLIQKK